MTAERSRPIASPVEHVFSLVEPERHLERFHPFVAANPAFAWSDTDRRDRIEYFSGLVLDRTFLDWVDGRHFHLQIGPPEAPNRNRVDWDFITTGADASEVSIRISRLAGDGPDDDTAMLERYLDSVLGGLAHLAEAGEPAVRNQFGPHPWFSPDA